MRRTDLADDIEALTREFADRAQALGYSVAVALIDAEHDSITAALNTANVSEATACVGQLLATILAEDPPSCPHCLNNYRRVEAGLRTMQEHATPPYDHDHLN